MSLKSFDQNLGERRMDSHDLLFMKEAIAWGDDCHPVKESIPKVGAIIAVGTTAIGRGRRGTGKTGDDEHAEFNALKAVAEKDKSKLAQATLYTTLEPCTGRVRSISEKACTELIRQHQIRKVFVGILDPNQGVTGKGLWRLQESGIDVALFPSDLSKLVLIQNVDFIRSQQTLGATIIAPKEGDELRTYESGGKCTIRFTCLNPPGDDTYLLDYQDGLYWPQSGPFRPIDEKQTVWEIDAHIGSTGYHGLQLVTADSLGNALIRYYRKVVAQNQSRKEKLRSKIDVKLLGGDYPGIEMNGLPKGLRLEASVKIHVAHKIELIGTAAEPQTAPRGKTLKITYEIECSEDIAKDKGIWLGASFRDAMTDKVFFNTSEDKAISLTKGKSTYDRPFTIAKDASPGDQKLNTNLWRGVVGDSKKSKWIAGGPPLAIKILE
jgi:pyrimidine deaminase RibD-like protein